MEIRSQIRILSRFLIVIVILLVFATFSYISSPATSKLIASIVLGVLTVVFSIRTISLFKLSTTATNKVFEITRNITVMRDFKKLLDYIIEEIKKLLQAETVRIYLLDTEKDELQIFFKQEVRINEIRISSKKGVVGSVIKAGRSINLKDAYRDPRFDREIDKLTVFKTKSLLCVPMFDVRGKIFGAIEALNKLNGHFTSFDEYLLSLLTQQVQASIDNSRLYEDKEKLFVSMMKALVAAIDARDPVTKGHSERVTRYSIALAKEIGLPEEEIRILEYAALLHDIGKIGIVDDILLKPSKYTSEEYEIVKTHALRTKEILDNIYFTGAERQIPLIASTHHEKLDGSGYPFKLRGKQINLLSRILAIADIYDAMVSFDRPYKPPETIEESLKYLREQAEEGKLDKRLVNVFIEKKLYILERRKFARVNAEFNIEYKILLPEELKTYSTIISKTKDIGGGGIMFLSDEPILINTYLDLVIHLPDYSFNTIGKVVHSTPIEEKSYRIGVMFLTLSEEAKNRLQKYLVRFKEGGEV